MAWFGKIKASFRKYLFPITAACGTSVIAAYFYPQTLGLQRYQRLVAHYKDGAMLPVDSETQQLIEKVFYFVLELHI